MRVLVIPDLHTPFNHPAAVDFLADQARIHKPDVFLCTGDEIDGHGWGRWLRSPDAPGQADELAAAVAEMKRLYKVVGKKARICRSNHGERALRSGARVGLPSAFIRTLKEVLQAPQGWAWEDSHIIDGVVYEHGEGYSGQNSALKAAQTNRCNTVIGHVHSWAGVQYNANNYNTIWGMNVGCLVDQKAIAMQYAKYSKAKAVLGCGLVVDGVPSFIPYREE